MTQKRQSLFRQAVMEEQASTGLGEVLILVPPRARFLVITTGAATILTSLFLCFATFSRTETVTGSLRVVGRPVQIMIPRTGSVDKVLVSDGEMVSPGQLLAVINTETLMEGGRSLQAVQIAALDKAKDALQQRQVRLQSRLSRARSVSRSENSNGDGTVPPHIEDALGEIDIKLAELEMEGAKIRASSLVELRAPVGGRIAYLKFMPGESVLAGDRMLSLAPATTDMTAELYIPVESVPHVKVNEPITLSLDSSISTDSETFEGYVASISEDLIPQDDLKQLDLGHAAQLVKVNVGAETVASIRTRYPSAYSLKLKGRLQLPQIRLWDWIVNPVRKSSKSLESYEGQ